jgi:ribonucleotide reductase class II
MKTPWSTVGYLTYKRTYARRLSDAPDSPTEEFEDTIDRVAKACDEQLHVNFTKSEETRLRQYLEELKGSVAGRFLWQLGTQTVDRLGLASLQNCAFCLVDNPIVPFIWAMDMLALGSGVGFNIQKQNVDKLPPVKMWFSPPIRVDDGGADFIIPDSRQGWVRFLAKTLKAAFLSDCKEKGTFTYSTQAIRGKGSPIKGFGGVASGPTDLVIGIQRISEVLIKRAGRKIRPIDALDIMNLIGQLIVAGNVRRCLPAWSLVHCQKGLTEIRNVSIGDNVLTSEGYSRVTNVFDQGVQKTIKIVTQDGSFECTPNHKMAVMTGVDEYVWKEAQYLTSEDRLASTRQPVEGTVTALPEDVAVELDGNLAWLIGAIHGNGYIYISKTSNDGSINIEFNANDTDEIKFAKQQLERFGYNTHTLKDPRQHSIRVTVNSERLSKYFFKYIKQPNTEIVIPDWIQNGTLDVRLGYLAGIFDTDGSKDHTPVRLVTTVYESFALSIQKLMYSCGLETRFTPNIIDKRGDRQQCFDVCIINDYVKYIMSGVPQLHKEMRLGNRDQYTNTYPQKWLYKYGYTSHSGGGNREIAVRNFSERTGIFPKLLPVKVLNIVEGADVSTFDIEVENVHEFFCEGYLTHNSAMIAIGDADDIEFLLAKRWDLGNIPSWRSMSNNTVVCSDTETLHDYFWDGYLGKGEPYGLLNMDLCRSVGRLGETQYPDPKIMGVNPCAEQTLEPYETCVAGDTRIQTRNGALKIEDLVGDAVEVFNGEQWSMVTPFIARTNDTLTRITFSDNSILDVNDDHEFLMERNNQKYFRAKTGELRIGDKTPRFELPVCEGPEDTMAYTLGAFTGDGYVDDGRCFIHTPSSKYGLIAHYENVIIYKEQHREGLESHVRVKTSIEKDLGEILRDRDQGLPDRIMSYGKVSALNFLAGLIDTDGGVGSTNGVDCYKIYSTSMAKLRDIQLLARRAGINSGNITLHTSKEKKSKLCGRNFDLLMLCFPSFACREIPTKLKIARGFGERFRKHASVDVMIDTSARVSVKSIEKLGGLHPTYCFTEPLKGMGVFGNVLTYQCCLATIFLPNIESKEELLDVATLLYRINKHSLQLPAHHPETSEVVLRNQRMGISLSGVLQATQEQLSWLDECYQYLREFDVGYSEINGFNRSIKLTTIQPSGTLSLLPGVTAGVHPAYAQYMYRRIRIAADHPLVAVCRKHGYPIEFQRNFDGTEDYGTVVVTFPFSYPKGTILAKEMSAIEQIKTVKKMQEVWSDNAVSCTVYYRKEELPEIKAYLKENYKDTIKTISFLLHNEHGFSQAPYEEVSYEEYMKLVGNTTVITSISSAEFDSSDECASGVCPVR